jgi:SAM-dependent methyltransferase
MTSLETVPCPVCRSTARMLHVDVPAHDENIRGYGEIYVGRDNSEWKICGGCGFVHQNPRPTIAALNAYYLRGAYHSRAEVVPPPPVLLERHARFYLPEVEFAIERSGLGAGRVFDIGCGRGVALSLFAERGWSCFGVDLVFSHHAFEHFADLDGALKGVSNILKPGGFIFTAIPTYLHNRTRLSKIWMNSAHYSLFTHRTFNRLLARHGFEEVAHSYDGWTSSQDQFGHLARFTGAAADSVASDDPAEVDRYLRVTNPLRSLLFYPLHGEYLQPLEQYRMLVRDGWKVLREQPAAFLPKTVAYLRSRWRS